jgi:hypothetical protein
VVASPTEAHLRNPPDQVAAGERQHRDLRRRWRHSDHVRRNRKLKGVEAVIDKDLCSSLLAEQLEADLLIIATDVDAAYIDWGKPTQKAIAQAHPDELERLGFAAGSMGPKVQAACEFARATGKVAVIGSLADIEAIVQGKAGTRVSTRKPASSTAEPGGNLATNPGAALAPGLLPGACPDTLPQPGMHVRRFFAGNPWPKA